MARKQALVPAHAPHGSEPATFQSGDVTAVQALASGTANDGQQKRALDWILKGACALGDWPYRDSERETCIGLGRQFVGQQIMGVLKLNVSALRAKESTTASRGDGNG